MGDLGPFLAAFVVFGAAGALVLQLAEADQEQEGGLRTRSAVALWLLAFFHANTVVSAAFTETGRIEALPRVPFLVVGLLLSAGGWLFFVLATSQLVRHGAFRSLDSTRLVTSGLYARFRHPQSLGWTVLLLGVAVASRSVLGLLLVAVFALFAARYARMEERQLRARFGAEYERYAGGSGTRPGRPAAA